MFFLKNIVLKAVFLEVSSHTFGVILHKVLRAADHKTFQAECGQPDDSVVSGQQQQQQRQIEKLNMSPLFLLQDKQSTFKLFKTPCRVYSRTELQFLSSYSSVRRSDGQCDEQREGKK